MAQDSSMEPWVQEWVEMQSDVTIAVIRLMDMIQVKTPPVSVYDSLVFMELFEVKIAISPMTSSTLE